MNRIQRGCCIATALLGISTVAMAEEVVVKLPTAKVLTGKNQTYPVVAALQQGDKLQVLAHEGPWLKVKIGDKEGYIGQNSVAAPGGGNIFSGAGKLVSSASGSKGASDAAAGQGVGEALKFAQSKNYSTAGLDRMIALSATVTPPEWEQFTTQGQVGPGKK